jgi:hypothetical protein
VQSQPGALTTPAPTEPTAETEARAPSLDFYGIDFSNRRQLVTIKIYPSDESVYHGRLIAMSFYPGESCTFGTRKACVYAYRSGVNGNVIFLTIHSGVGGEAQRFRAALEGTWINSAAFSLDQVQKRLQDLAGATVVISQGDRVAAELKLTALGRVPAAKLQRYMRVPPDNAVAFAAASNPSLVAAVNPSQPQIVFETCGWKIPDEPWAPGVSATSAAIYLGVIQKAE